MIEYIHAGNTPADTAGCILPGENRKPGHVLNSRHYVALLKRRIVEAKERGEGVWVRIVSPGASRSDTSSSARACPGGACAD